MKITLYMAMALNGYIAKEDDKTPWSKPIWKSYYKIAKSFKAIILGRRTYQIMKDAGEFNKIGNPFTVVITNAAEIDDEKFAFVKTHKDSIKLLKNKGFKKALLGGGGKLNSYFIKEKLIDEIYLDIEPILFGKGIKLFAEEDFETKLKLISAKKLSKDIMQVHYKVI